MESNMNSIDILQSDNDIIADKSKKLLHKCLDKLIHMVDDADTPRDVQICIEGASTITKVVGLSPDKNISNITVNPIAGFLFVEADVEAIKQEKLEQEYIDASIV